MCFAIAALPHAPSIITQGSQASRRASSRATPQHHAAQSRQAEEGGIQLHGPQRVLTFNSEAGLRSITGGFPGSQRGPWIRSQRSTVTRQRPAARHISGLPSASARDGTVILRTAIDCVAFCDKTVRKPLSQTTVERGFRAGACGRTLAKPLISAARLLGFARTKGGWCRVGPRNLARR